MNNSTDMGFLPMFSYDPFGMITVGRSWEAGTEYRYGFNGKESDSETYGDGNIYDYGFRIYNPRIGKFLSVDPLQKKYAWYTPYQFAGNQPIWAIDLDGLEEFIVTYVYKNGEIVFRNVSYVQPFDRPDGMKDGVLYQEDFGDGIVNKSYRGNGSTFDVGTVEAIAMQMLYQTKDNGLQSLEEIMRHSEQIGKNNPTLKFPGWEAMDPNLLSSFISIHNVKINFDIPVQFQTNMPDTYLNDEAKAIAESYYVLIADLLKNNPDIIVDITGHTDNVPADSYKSSSGTGNDALSSDRASFVANELVTKYGVNPAQIGVVEGKGSSDPMVPNNPAGTPEGTPENRRVEIMYHEF